MQLPSVERALTIAEYVAELGAPRTYAEQSILQQMHHLEAEHARIQEVRDAGACSALAHMILNDKQHGLWRAAMELYFAVRTFREHGDTPPWPQKPTN